MGDIIPNLICSSPVQKSGLQHQIPVTLYQTLGPVLRSVSGLLRGLGAALALLSPKPALDTQLAPRRRACPSQRPLLPVGGYDKKISDIAGGSRVVTVSLERELGKVVLVGSGVGLEKFSVLASPSSALPSYASSLGTETQRGGEEPCVHVRACVRVCAEGKAVRAEGRLCQMP